MKKALLVALCFLVFGGCGVFVSEKDAIDAAKKHGFENPEVLDKHIFFVKFRGCSKEDDAVFKVDAINASGKKVSIIVCSGWPFKGSTIRTK